MADNVSHAVLGNCGHKNTEKFHYRDEGTTDEHLILPCYACDCSTVRLPSTSENESAVNPSYTNKPCAPIKPSNTAKICDDTSLVNPSKCPAYGDQRKSSPRYRAMYSKIRKIRSEKQLHMSSKSKQQQKQLCNDKKQRKPSREIFVSRLSSDKLLEPVTKYDSEILDLLIQFVWSDTVIITGINVSGLYYGAVEFGLLDLIEACRHFAKIHLKVGHSKSVQYTVL